MAIHKLGTNPKIEALTAKPGKHSDGGGLSLKVAAPGQGSWVVRFGGRDGSLGPADLITIHAARNKHHAMRMEKHEGRDPWALLRSKTIIPGLASLAHEPAEPGQADQAIAGITRQRFADVVDGFLLHSPAVSGWKAKSTEPRKYRKLKDGSLGKLWADEATSADVAAELQTRWGHALVSAEKNRMRIKLVFDYARAKGFRDKNATNPANNDDIKNLVAKPPKGKSHPSMAVADIPEFMEELSVDKSRDARALAFTVLTAARTAETLQLDWSEISGNVWTVPALRMKEGETNGAHFVPLSPAALALMGRRKKAGLVFGDLAHDALDDKLKEFREMGSATVHGFRASFNGWAVKAGYPESLWGRALHHAVGDKTGRAYNREPLTEERRPMMDAWADFATSLTQK